MGQEIDTSEFSPADFLAFSRRLEEETALLGRALDGGRFHAGSRVGGFELEAWLVDAAARPAPLNEALLERLGDPLVVPELARFNVELNGIPRAIAGGGLRCLHQELEATYQTLERHYRDAIALTIYEGTSNIQRVILSRGLLGRDEG